jgi:chromosome segregation ATPase
MPSILNSLGRWFRWIGYALTGRVDDQSARIARDPHAMRGAYDDVLHEKAGRVRQFKDAVAGLIAQREKKKSALHALSEEIQHLDRLKAGALAKARQAADGRSKGELATDENYQRCRSAYSNFSSTLVEKEQRAMEIEADVVEAEQQVSTLKVQLQDLLRDLDLLRGEREEAVADVITSEETRKVAEMVAGISEDQSGQTLSQLRDVRARARAQATISTEMSGMDAKAEEAEFLAYARENAADSEFDALVFGENSSDAEALAIDEVPELDTVSSGGKSGSLPS